MGTVEVEKKRRILEAAAVSYEQACAREDTLCAQFQTAEKALHDMHGQSKMAEGWHRQSQEDTRITKEALHRAAQKFAEAQIISQGGNE